MMLTKKRLYHSRSDQDVTDTLCVSEHVLKQIKKDYPNLTILYRTPDNVACYSGNSVKLMILNYNVMIIMSLRKAKTKLIEKVQLLNVIKIKLSWWTKRHKDFSCWD